MPRVGCAGLRGLAVARPGCHRLAGGQHLVGAGVVPAEQNGEWTESGRHMRLEILAACRKGAQPDVGQDHACEAGLTIEEIPA